MTSKSESPLYLHDDRRNRPTQRSLLNMLHQRTGVRWSRLASHPWRFIKRLLHSLLLMLGVIYLAIIIHSFLDGLCPDTLDWIANRWPTTPTGSWQSGGSQVYPIACHSHNDYWRSRPLYTALEYGCSGIEADVWLGDNQTLLVGHVPRALSPDRTLASLYLEPLVQILDENNPQAVEVDRYNRHHLPAKHGLNGVFETDSRQSLVLLIDFKSNGNELWPLVYESLDHFRRKAYLTYWNGTNLIQGPLTIVVSGNAPFQNIIENSNYRDIFFDAPLDLMSALVEHPQQIDHSETGLTGQHQIEHDPLNLPWLDPTNPTSYDISNSYYASVSFKRSIGYPTHSHLSSAQMSLIRAQIRGAHEQGLKVRYWSVPSWPLGVRNFLWRVMVREGVDILSVDDVKAVATEDWGPRKGGWGRKWWT